MLVLPKPMQLDVSPTSISAEMASAYHRLLSVMAGGIALMVPMNSNVPVIL